MIPKTLGFGRFARGTAVAASLLGMALVMGACSGDDDDGGGGGGGLKFKAPPTARPSLAGMTVRIDVSGGNGTAGAGGDGGTVALVASNGSLRSAGGGASADNNFLTAGVLADNTVSYTELAAIDPLAIGIDGTTAIIDLYGRDFHLPSGATLNLGDAAFGVIDTINIRTNLSGDVIRIDGTVVTARAGNIGPTLQLITMNNTGAALTINGTINANGATGQDGGTFAAIANSGHIVLNGSITSRGSNAASGLEGGVVQLVASQGDVLVAAGQFVAHGGTGTTDGGEGGSFQGVASSVLSSSNFNWGFAANGGSAGSGAGGVGGQFVLDGGDWVNLFTPVQLDGGDSTTGAGGSGGQAAQTAGTTTGVLQIQANGGSGAATGGNGGAYNPVLGGQLLWYNIQSFAFVFTANGGDGTTDAGDGGIVGPSQSAAYGWTQQVRFEVTAHGGAGTTGPGSGGGISTFIAVGSCDNFTVDIQASGGNGTTLGGNGGGTGTFACYGIHSNVRVTGTINGGDASAAAGTAGDAGNIVFISAALGGSSNATGNRIEVTANGGNAPAGDTGGNGGTVQVQCGLANQTGEIGLSVLGTYNGGNAGGAAGSGGAGGGVVISSIGAITGGQLTANFIANGGTGTSAGGQGGGIQTQLGGLTEVTGTVTANGGQGIGTGDGGEGGSLTVLASMGYGHVLIRNLNFTALGGNSDQDVGGQGGTVLVDDVNCEVTVTGGNFVLNGGNGATVSGTADGGSGGTFTISTLEHNVDVRTTVSANGGTGTDSGGSGGLIELYTDTGGTGSEDGRGAFLYADSAFNVNGGNGLVNGDGGDAGTIYAWPYNYSEAFAFGEAELRGTWNANGGNGAGTGDGGFGGVVYIYGGVQFLRTFATINANGGTGVTGGDGGDIYYGMDGTGLITIGRSATANGGAGTTTGGAGGSVYAESPGTGGEIVVNSGVTLRANGGAAAGAAGTIDLDAEGAAGANVTTTGATLQTNTGAGVAVPANITID